MNVRDCAELFDYDFNFKQISFTVQLFELFNFFFLSRPSEFVHLGHHLIYSSAWPTSCYKPITAGDIALHLHLIDDTFAGIGSKPESFAAKTSATPFFKIKCLE